MSHLPLISGLQLCKALRKLGYLIDHQTGSHMILRNENAPFRRLTIPNHKEIAKGTLKSITRQAGISVDELKSLLT